MILLYLAVVFLGAALLGPLLYASVQALEPAIPALGRVSGSPLHRYLNRAMLLLAVLGLPFVLRRLDLWGWRSLGLGSPREGAVWLVRGLGVGFFSLALVAAIPLLTGARDLRPGIDAADVAGYLASAAATAFVVGSLEELLFRGVVFGGLRRAHSWRLALVASSSLYALVHFFARPPPPEAVRWSSGFLQLSQMLAGFVDPARLIPGFFNLLIAGAILAFAYHWSGSLYAAIGLHAGWIFWLKLYGRIVAPPGGADLWLWGSRRLVDGWLASLVFLVGILLFGAIRAVHRRPSSATVP